MDPSAEMALHAELSRAGIEMDIGQAPHSDVYPGLTSFAAARSHDGKPCWVHLLTPEPRPEVVGRLNELAEQTRVRRADLELVWEIGLITTQSITVVQEERPVAPATVPLAEDVSDRPRDWSDLMIRLMPICDALARLAAPEHASTPVTHGDIRTNDLYLETATGLVRLGGFVRGALCRRIGESGTEPEARPDAAALIDVLVALADPPHDAIDSCRAAVRALSGQPYAAALALKEAFRDASQRGEAVVVDTDVQFSLYRPQAIQPGRWHSVLAFAHKTEFVHDEFGAVLDPVAQVEAQAAALLASENTPYSSTRTDSGTALGKGADLTFELWLEESEVNPPCAHLHWHEAIHRVEFRVRTMTAPEGARLKGGLRVFSAHMLIGEARFALQVSATATDTSAAADPPTKAEPVDRYRKIFASYSHRDGDVVAAVRRFTELTGDRYLVDADTLRSGEAWSPRLSELIEAADVFQLFWSENSMRSPHVRHEWEHALSLGRDHFVRPVYWEQPFPRDRERGLPPEDLLTLHFSSLGPAPVTESTSAAYESSRASVTSTFCRECGTKVALDQVFCGTCGSYLRTVQLPPPPDPERGEQSPNAPWTAPGQGTDEWAWAPTQTPTSQPPQSPGVPPTSVPGAPYGYGPPPAGRRVVGWPVAAGVLAVIAVIVVLVLVLVLVR